MIGQPFACREVNCGAFPAGRSVAHTADCIIGQALARVRSDDARWFSRQRLLDAVQGRRSLVRTRRMSWPELVDLILIGMSSVELRRASWVDVFPTGKRIIR
jgi:hypothetical protein